MIIGVDAGALSITDQRLKVGVYRTTYALLKALGKLDTANEYRLYSFIPIPAAVMGEFGPRMKNVVLRPVQGWFAIRLPLELAIRPVDVFLGLSQSLPRNTSYNILFVHDLAFLEHSEWYAATAETMKKRTQEAVRRAQAIIAISHSTATALTTAYPQTASRLTVAYEGVDETLFYKRPAKQVAAIKKKYGLPQTYFLYVGAFKPGKNLERIVGSVQRFNQARKAPIPLVVVGSNYWEEAPKDAEIQLLGFVPDEDLAAIYSGAIALVSPSLAEGFGLPHVEAMSCGTPVVGATAGSLPEVIGNGGICVDPQNVEAMTVALEKVVQPAVQKTLRQRAIQQAAQFTWDKFARATLSCINR